MNIIVCGYNWIGCAAVAELITNGHNLFVYTHISDSHINSLSDFCEENCIPYTFEKIDRLNIPFIPDVICSVYYRYIINDEIISLVNGKIFNLHPSLLPNYKGCSSLTWAMINGEEFAGYTFHYLTKEVDCGNIILQKKLPIYSWDTQVTLYHRVMFEALNDFIFAFERVLIGYEGFPQELGGTYYHRGCPYKGEINPNWDDITVKRFIRAMNYPPLPSAKFFNKEVKTFKDFKEILNS